MVGYHPLDGRLPSLGWSPTITRPRMVIQHPRNGHLSALGWSPIIQNHLPKYCHPASKGWLPTIPSIVHHPKLRKSDKTLRNTTKNYIIVKNMLRGANCIRLQPTEPDCSGVHQTALDYSWLSTSAVVWTPHLWQEFLTYCYAYCC